MKAYAQSKGIAIIGVALLFVVLDSADVWADPRIFAVSKESRPEAVTEAGTALRKPILGLELFEG